MRGREATLLIQMLEGGEFIEIYVNVLNLWCSGRHTFFSFQLLCLS